MKEGKSFYNKVVIQGNSLCIRIPKSIVHKLDIEKGSVVNVNIINIDKETKKLPKELITSYKIVKEMNQFSTNEIEEFLKYLSIEKTSEEIPKVNSKYDEFKKILNNKKNKEAIKRALYKTNFWKNSQKIRD